MVDTCWPRSSGTGVSRPLFPYWSDDTVVPTCHICVSLLSFPSWTCLLTSIPLLHLDNLHILSVFLLDLNILIFSVSRVIPVVLVQPVPGLVALPLGNRLYSVLLFEPIIQYDRTAVRVQT